MEMKTNNVDLLIRQMPKSQKTEETSGSDRSGFKKMMREKDLRKDTGSKDKRDLNKELETAASSTGVPQAPQDQKSDAAESKDQQEKDAMIQSLKSLNGQMPDVLKSKGDAADAKAMDSFQMLKEFRLKNWNPKDDSTLIQEKLDFNELNSQMPKKTVPDSQLGLEVQGNLLALPKDGEKKEVKGPGEALMKMSEQKGPGSKEILSEKGPGVLTAKKGIYADGPGYRLRTDEKDNLTDEDAAQEKFPGMLQDKLIEPGHMSEMSTHKTQSADVTLPVQNLEELNAKLSEQIMSQIKTDQKSLEVQLEPHNLGKILIKVAYEKDQMSVSVVCTESKTLKLLSQSAGELGNILENNLERPVHVIVDKHQADYLDNGQEQQGNGREQQEHRQNHSDDVGDDFIQKLRLGISDPDSDDMNE